MGGSLRALLPTRQWNVPTSAEPHTPMPKLTRIYTRTGDDGTTGLVGGQRVRKNDPRIEAYGCVDELSSAIGVVRAALADVQRTRPAQDVARALDVAHRLDGWLAWTQDVLFNLGSDLATLPGDRWEGMPLIHRGRCRRARARHRRGANGARAARQFHPSRRFVSGAFLHVARTIARRAERLLLTLHERDAVSGDVLRYVNRLSDALFVWSRWINAALDQPEHLWNANTQPPPPVSS